MAGMVPSEVHVEVGGEINLGGVKVRPGDLIAADMDGVFVCPSEYAADAVALAREFLASESKTHKAIATGKTIVAAYPSKAPK
jgi:regulator of RNase E activity RraA